MDDNRTMSQMVRYCDSLLASLKADLPPEKVEGIVPGVRGNTVLAIPQGHDLTVEDAFRKFRAELLAIVDGMDWMHWVMAPNWRILICSGNIKYSVVAEIYVPRDQYISRHPQEVLF